jgi:hypothetical protein
VEDNSQSYEEWHATTLNENRQVMRFDKFPQKKKKYSREEEDLYSTFVLFIYVQTANQCLRAGIVKPHWKFIAEQRLGKHVNVKMNTQATVAELPFLCNSEINARL